MKLEEAIANLEEYINLDKTLRDSNKEEWNDFDKFCDSHCENIATVLKYIKEESIPKEVVEEKLKELVKEANFRTVDNPKGRVHFIPEPEDYQIMILQEILNKGE